MIAKNFFSKNIYKNLHVCAFLCNFTLQRYYKFTIYANIFTLISKI